MDKLSMQTPAGSLLTYAAIRPRTCNSQAKRLGLAKSRANGSSCATPILHPHADLKHTMFASPNLHAGSHQHIPSTSPYIAKTRPVYLFDSPSNRPA